MPDQKLLSVENLSIEAGDTTIIEAVDLEIKPGEMVGLVGESGSGKSVTALALMRLLASKRQSPAPSLHSRVVPSSP